MSIKIGDMVEVLNNANYFEPSFTGHKEVKQIYWEDSSGACVGVEDDTGGSKWSIMPIHYKYLGVKQKTPNYAAAFNMWQDDFCNNPQAYEDSQTVAIRHLTEKLNGEEPSYGQIAAQMLIEYLEKTA